MHAQQRLSYPNHGALRNVAAGPEMGRCQDDQGRAMLEPAELVALAQVGVTPSAARAHALVERLPNSALIGVRFLYGMRSVGPAVIGSGNMTCSRFVLLDAVAASWSACWIGAGYVLGETVEQLQREFISIGGWLLVGVVAGTGLVTCILYLRRRRTKDV
jgi:membrane protein DedA with SNARE-associated domain